MEYFGIITWHLFSSNSWERPLPERISMNHSIILRFFLRQRLIFSLLADKAPGHSRSTWAGALVIVALTFIRSLWGVLSAWVWKQVQSMLKQLNDKHHLSQKHSTNWSIGSKNLVWTKILSHWNLGNCQIEGNLEGPVT